MKTFKRYHVMDRASGILDAQLLSSVTSGTFTISSLSQLGSQDWNAATGDYLVVTIDDEQIECSDMSEIGGTATLTINTRAFADTTAALHTAGTTVYIRVVKVLLEEIRDELANHTQGLIGLDQTSITDANTHTAGGDLTGIFTPGRGYQFEVGTTWYRAVIRSSSYGGGVTTIELTGDGLPSSGTVVACGVEFNGSLHKAVDYALIKEATNVPADSPPSGYSWLFAKGKGWHMKDSDGKVRYLNAVVASASSSGGDLALDWSVANFYEVDLTENITGVSHSNGVDGEKYTLRLKQHASAAKTVTIGTAGGTRFGTDVPSYTMTPTVSLTDYLLFIYNADASKYDFLGPVQGF